MVLKRLNFGCKFYGRLSICAHFGAAVRFEHIDDTENPIGYGILNTLTATLDFRPKDEHLIIRVEVRGELSQEAIYYGRDARLASQPSSDSLWLTTLSLVSKFDWLF